MIWDNSRGKRSAVGKCDTDTDQHITNYKIKNPVSDSGWKNVDPHFMDIKQFPEENPSDAEGSTWRRCHKIRVCPTAWYGFCSGIG